MIPSVRRRSKYALFEEAHREGARAIIWFLRDTAASVVAESVQQARPEACLSSDCEAKNYAQRGLTGFCSRGESNSPSSTLEI